MQQQKGTKCSAPGCDGFASYTFPRAGSLEGDRPHAAPGSPVGPLKCEYGHEAMYSLGDLYDREVAENGTGRKTTPILQEGDRVRWVTSGSMLTFEAGQQAEVVSVTSNMHGLRTQFKNLDYKGETQHLYVVVGEIPEDQCETIPKE